MSVGDLPARLREICADVGGPSAMAKKAGVPLRTLNEHLAGTKISTERLVAYADAAGIRVDWLATGEGPKGRSDTESLVARVREHREIAEHEVREAAAELGLDVVRRSGSASISVGVRTSATGSKTMEGGQAVDAPARLAEPPTDAYERATRLDSKVLIECLEEFFDLLDRRHPRWTNRKKAEEFVDTYEEFLVTKSLTNNK